MFTYLLVAIAGGIAFLLVLRKRQGSPKNVPLEEWIDLKELEQKVHFYTRLSEMEKAQFRTDLSDFLNRVRLVGVGLEINKTDRLLVAASAVIPVFHFPQWQFYDLDEVLLFESAVNLDFKINQPDSTILGMVGTGNLERKMILTREALTEGFSNKTDKYNVGIHEFLHLIDKEDGLIDGLPKVLMDKQYSLPWLRHIRSKIHVIHTNKSDIDAYGATNLSEFLAVAGEYFFERPELFRLKHPKLFHQMNQMFKGHHTS